MRKSNEEVQEIMRLNNATEIYSWSKIQTYHTDPYSYLLRYILKVPPDRGDNSYSYLGGITHSLLEDFYDNKYTNEEMIQQFHEKVMLNDMAGIKFSSNDDQNETIKNKYVDCISHFLREYVKDDNAKLEQYVYGYIGDYFFGGYIDKMHGVDGVLYIDDFKTSTIYSNQKIENDKGQLFIYAILMHQTYNIPYEKICVRWNFLKYAKITYTQINGKQAVTYIERNKIGDKLTAKIKTWLKKYKYTDDEINEYIKNVCEANTIHGMDRECIKCLPQEIQEKFIIEDGLLEVPINEQEVEEFIKNFTETCAQVVEKTKLYNDSKDEKIFWSDINKNNSYYYSNLCSYSAKHHKPLKEYYDNLEKMQTETTVDINSDDELMKILFS